MDKKNRTRRLIYPLQSMLLALVIQDGADRVAWAGLHTRQWRRLDLVLVHIILNAALCTAADRRRTSIPCPDYCERGASAGASTPF